jgi:hypothetical protein
MENQNQNESQDLLPSISNIVTSLKENATDVSEYLKGKINTVADMSLKDIHQSAVDSTSK